MTTSTGPANKPIVIAIIGPTASGKSALAVALAKKIGGEIISADSRQIYKGLDIATGKITKHEMKGVPHHMLDVCPPTRLYSSGQFLKDAQKKIDDITKGGKIPIVVGGTGYYIDALLGRMLIPEVEPNQKLREKLELKTTAQLFSLLKKKDPARAKNIEPDHKRRLIRALEIADALGKNPTPKIDEPYTVLWLGMKPTDEELSKNIQLRVAQRMKKGMVKEAQTLHHKGLSYKRMEELGLEYRSLAQFLRGHTSKKELVLEIERGNLKYAKRQMRWFKRNPNIRWVSNYESAQKAVRAFL